MIKKYLVMIAALGTAMVGTAGATANTSSMSSTSAAAARSSFIQGWFIGLNPGYQINKINGQGKSANFNSPSIGAHFDYNHLVSNPLFLGVGLDANYCLKSKKVDGGGKLRKELSGALTGRLGVVSGPVAFNVNVAVLVTGFKATKANGQGTESQSRTGFAPGVGITFCVAKNVSAGINYRYEIYPKRKGGTKPRIDSHNIFAKISYNLPK